MSCLQIVNLKKKVKYERKEEVAVHCMQKSGNKWLGAKVHRLGRQKHNRSLFQDTVFLHKGLILPSFMLLPKMWVHVQLKRI